MSGIALAISAGLGFGVFQTLNRKAGEQLDPVRGTFILLVVSTVMLAAIAAVTDGIDTLLDAPGAAFIYFALAGFIHFFLGWTMLSYSQKQIGAARTGAVVGMMPLFGLVVDILFYDETFTLPALAGVFLIVGGVYIISFR
jgi:drug/metabolite transporter (DMT)-like permease